MANTKLVLVLKAIAAITVVSGLVQMVRPQWILALVGGEATPAASHFFGIVGMFMVLFGGLLWQALRAPRPQPIPVFWCGLQKLGATGAVGLAVGRDLLSGLALGVAGFDLLSAILILLYWGKIRNAPGGP
jgi:hypothetical protein